MNIHVQVFVWTNAFSFLAGGFPQVELLCYMVMLHLIFWRTTKLFSKAVAPFYIPTNNVWEFQCLYILTRLVTVWLFGYNHPNGYEVTSHWRFDSHFPDGQWNWAFFQVLVEQLCLFFKEIFVVVRILLDTWPWSDMICKCFISFCRLFFHFLG